jgi:hypothetical protein
VWRVGTPTALLQVEEVPQRPADVILQHFWM